MSEIGSFNPLTGITAIDTFGAAIAVNSNFDEIRSGLGVKTLTYTAIDIMGNKTTVSVELNIYENPVIVFANEFPTECKINAEVNLSQYITAADSYGETLEIEIIFDTPPLKFFYKT